MSRSYPLRSDDTLVNADTLRSSTLIQIEEAPSGDTLPELSNHLALAELRKQYLPEPMPSSVTFPSQVAGSGNAKKIFPLILSVGVLIGMLFAGSIHLSTQNTKATEPAVALLGEQISNSQDLESTLLEDTVRVDVEPKLAISDPINPTLEKFITNTSIPVTEHKIVAPTSVPRIHEPSATLEGFEFGKTAHHMHLARNNSGTSRFNNSLGGPEWQGGWNMRNPQQNNEIAESYKRYLQEAGSHSLSRGDTLSSVRQSSRSIQNPSVSHRILLD